MCWHCIVRGRLMQAKSEKKLTLDERQLFPLNKVPRNDGERGPGSRCFLTASNVSQFEKNSSRRVGGVYHCASSVVQAHETRSGMPGLQYCCFSNGLLCDSRPTIRHEDRLKNFGFLDLKLCDAMVRYVIHRRQRCVDLGYGWKRRLELQSNRINNADECCMLTQ